MLQQAPSSVSLGTNQAWVDGSILELSTNGTDEDGYHVMYIDRLLESKHDVENILYPMQRLVLDQCIKDEFK